MKTRNGFVSNSSSSSFIVGIAKVTDIDKLRAYFKKHGIEDTNFDVKICSVSDICDGKVYTVTANDHKINVESFQSSVSINKKKLSPNDKLLVVNIMNDEGDGDFSEYDLDGEFFCLNYDISIDDFSEKQIAIYRLFNNKDDGIDVTTSDVSYGAGRNG